MKIQLNKLYKFLILIFFWTVLPLLSVELIMILLEPYLSMGMYQYDPDLGFKVRPYSGHTNQFGFNDRDYPIPKTPENYRILMISDSFGWRGGLEGNYTALLEHNFETHYGQHQVDVINTGYIGTHAGEQLSMLKKYGIQYQPDLVILGFFAGNDFIDADPNRKRIIVNDLFIDIDKNQELKILGYPIIFKSRLLLFIQQKYKIAQELARAKKETRPTEELKPNSLEVLETKPKELPAAAEEGFFTRETYLAIVRAKMDFCNKYNLKLNFHQEHIQFVFDSIDEMNELLEHQSIKFFVAIYPDEYQVNEKLFQDVIAEFDLDEIHYERFCQQIILKQHLEAKNIPYLDLRETFLSQGKNQDLYLLRDTHWNHQGEKLAADLLFQWILPEVEVYFQQ